MAMPNVVGDEFWVLKGRVILVALVIGLVGLAVSCLNTDNPQGSEDVYMGYPVFAFIASRSLLISFPPIPSNVTVLWLGFIVDLLLYTSAGLVVSFLAFSLGENLRLLRFMIKSGFLFLVGSFLVLGILSIGNGSPYSVVPPIILAGQVAFFFALAAAPVTTVMYGYYRLFKKHRSQQRPP